MVQSASWGNLMLLSVTRLGLEKMKQTLPADFARMDHGPQIGSKTFPDVSGLPNVFRSVNGHIDQNGRTYDIFARNEAPVAAVVRILAIVAHHEILPGGNFVRYAIFLRIRRIGTVRFAERLPIHVDHTGLDFDGVAGKPDAAFDEIRIALFGQRRSKYDDLLAFRLAPQRHVIGGEGNSRVVTDAADDQMIADQNRAFHRAAGDDSRLHQRAFDKKEGHNYPKP